MKLFMNIFLFISGIFIVTFLLGKLLEKIRIPWIFAALVLGAVLAIANPFPDIIESNTFSTFAQIGMYLLLFLVGLELDIDKLKEKSNFLFRSSLFIILLEGILGTLVVHFAFDYSWLVSGIVALSFATVGEALLVPILQEFGLVKKKVGRTMLGIGAIDDSIEILMLIVASVVVGSQVEGASVPAILIGLVILFLLLFGLAKFKDKGEQFRFKSIETFFLFFLFIFFLFVGIGTFAAAAPLAALLAGVGLRMFLPENRLAVMESEIKTMTYGLFAPIFFVWVGASLDMKFLAASPLLVLLVIGVSKGAKLFGSYVMTKKELGPRGAILTGIGLSVRFSTSIIIIKFLYDNGIVGSDIYSVIIASSIIFKFIIPVLFSQLASRWKFEDSEDEEQPHEVKVTMDH